jgi:hypothetical protein
MQPSGCSSMPSMPMPADAGTAGGDLYAVPTAAARSGRRGRRDEGHALGHHNVILGSGCTNDRNFF